MGTSWYIMAYHSWNTQQRRPAHLKVDRKQRKGQGSNMSFEVTFYWPNFLLLDPTSLRIHYLPRHHSLEDMEDLNCDIVLAQCISDFTHIFLSPGRQSAHIHKLRQPAHQRSAVEDNRSLGVVMNKVSGELPQTHALPALQVGDSGKQSTMHFVPQSDMAYWDKVLKYILALFKDWDERSPGCLGQLLLTSGCCVPVRSPWANPRPPGKLFYYQEIILCSRG